MAIALDTRIVTSSGLGRTWPSHAKLVDGVLEGRRRVTEDPIINETEQRFDSGISIEPLPGAHAVNATNALGVELAEWVWSSPGRWQELSTLHQLVLAAGADCETGAAGPTTFEDELRDARQGSYVRSFSELADELTADVPDSEWDKVPTDLVRNLDHYLYGAPKEDE